MWFIELRYTIVRMHKPLFIPMNQAYDKIGPTFRSVYAYPEEVLKDRETTKNFFGTDLAANTLFIDIDNGQSTVERIEHDLKMNDVYFEKWDTGNRGAHFHVGTPFIVSPYLHQFHKFTLSSYWPDLIEKNLIDCSIYNPSGQIRMPGAVHNKTGRVKLLEYVHKGQYLLDILEGVIVKSKDRLEYVATSDSYNRLVLSKVYPGGRHLHIMKIVKEGIVLNYSLDKVFEDVLFWNRYGALEPLPFNEVETHVSKCWRQF